jgi:hypothetical protein
VDARFFEQRRGHGRVVQGWEAGERPIPGPVIVLTELLLRAGSQDRRPSDLDCVPQFDVGLAVLWTHRRAMNVPLK